MCIATLLSVPNAEAEGIERLNTYYFGNSFTGNTMPGLHPLLGESAGKQWTVKASIAPGVPIWSHMKRQMDKGRGYEVFQEVGKYGFYVHQPDLAVHLDITPERAKVINDTIWKVVAGHPYSWIKKSIYPSMSPMPAGP